MKPKTVLASVSSSDREFSAHKLRESDLDIHSNIIYKNKIILNNGFPVNFDGQEIIAPLEKIQFTVALVLYAIYQATSKSYKTNRFVQLNKKVQTYLSNQLLLQPLKNK